MTKIKIATIVAAAGEGRRAGGDVPKPYQRLADQPVLLQALTAVLPYGQVQPVIREADRELYRHVFQQIEDRQNIRPPVIGGATRAASVLAGLKGAPRSAS